MRHLPSISFVIATRNAAAVLPGCLESLRTQSCREFEVLAIDCASTDGTADVLASSADIITRWVSEPDDGIAQAWNKALALARGGWLWFLGADDRLWDRQVVERLLPHLRSATERVVYTQVRHVRRSGEVVEEIGEPWARAKVMLRTLRSLPHQGVLHHRRLFEIHGRFDEGFRFVADHEFLLRELKGADALFVPCVTTAVGEGGLTTRPENYLALLRETRAALAAHGLRTPPLRWAFRTSCAWLYLRLRALLGDRTARRLADLYRVVTLRRRRYWIE